jgi:hypothetical protein
LEKEIALAEASVERSKGYVLVRLIDLDCFLVKTLYVGPQGFSFSLSNVEEIVYWTS